MQTTRIIAALVILAALLGVNADYDFIVVGGGAAGSALAASLAEKGYTLLLERGDSNEAYNASKTLSGWPDILTTDAARKIRCSDANTPVWLIEANVLGGGTTINCGALFQSSNDFFTKNLPEFDLRKVQRAYKWVEDQVASDNVETPLIEDIKNAFVDTGLPFNGRSIQALDGVQYTKTTFTDGKGKGKGKGKRNRRSAAKFLRPNPRLTVITSASVEKVLFDTTGPHPKAVGVTYVDIDQNEIDVFVWPTGEVFLSAGAFRSPQLLMLSGIGDAATLTGLGIDVIFDNAEVGQNLIDRPVSAVLFPTNAPVEEQLVPVTASGDTFNLESTMGGSISATMLGVTGAFLPPPLRDEATLELLSGLTADPTAAIVIDFINQGIQFNSLTTALSTGSVVLNSADPSDDPIITLNYYSNPVDLQNAAQNLARVQQAVNSVYMQNHTIDAATAATMAGVFTAIASIPIIPPALQASFGALAASLTAGGAVTLPAFPDFTNSVEVGQWLYGTLVSGYHYVGSNCVGKVVDSKFKVNGVRGLRVVDASVLPQLTPANPQMTIMMLGRYASSVTPPCKACCVPENTLSADKKGNCTCLDGFGGEFCEVALQMVGLQFANKVDPDVPINNNNPINPINPINKEPLNQPNPIFRVAPEGGDAWWGDYKNILAFILGFLGIGGIALVVYSKVKRGESSPFTRYESRNYNTLAV